MIKPRLRSVSTSPTSPDCDKTSLIVITSKNQSLAITSLFTTLIIMSSIVLICDYVTPSHQHLSSASDSEAVTDFVWTPNRIYPSRDGSQVAVGSPNEPGLYSGRCAGGGGSGCGGGKPARPAQPWEQTADGRTDCTRARVSCTVTHTALAS